MSALPPLLLRGDCLHELKLIPDASVDAVVTDPPYGLANTDPVHVVETLTRWAAGERDFIPTGRGFMGKAWDAFVPPPAVWDECARILKPGGHLLAFAGSRTFDLMTFSIRFAGFDIRDSIAWLYGSGFPKSLDVSKAIDKAEGAERTGGAREWSGGARAGGVMGAGEGTVTRTIFDSPATDKAAKWEGWGTALKPAFEPIVVARKPFPGTVAANVLAHGTGALNIDATRVGDGPSPSVAMRASGRTPSPLLENEKAAVSNARGRIKDRSSPEAWAAPKAGELLGRWPANVVLDEPQAAALDEQSGHMKDGVAVKRNLTGGSRTSVGATGIQSRAKDNEGYGAGGGASRFFYVAKAPKSERPVVDGTAHPTVKPLALMRWLLRLVTPPRGVIVDPFAGSGTTLEAAYLEDFDAIGVEMTPDYWPLIEARIARATEHRGQHLQGCVSCYRVTL